MYATVTNQCIYICQTCQLGVYLISIAMRIPCLTFKTVEYRISLAFTTPKRTLMNDDNDIFIN